MMFALFSLIGFLAAHEAHGNSHVTKNVVQVAQNTADLSTLVSALTKADLLTPLASVGPYTIFAPKNAAFTALPAGVLTNLLKPEKKILLTNLWKYHVVAGSKMSASSLTNNTKVATMLTQSVTSIISGGKTMITGSFGSATVTTADVAATNGVIHIINKVMIPMNIVELAQNTPTLSTLVSAVVAADLVTTLSGDGPFTVFAPTNAAFTALPAGKLTSLLKPANKAELVSVLTYHVVAGKPQMKVNLVNDHQMTTVQKGTYKVKVSATPIWTIWIGKTLANAGSPLPKVTSADVEAYNGIVHVVDKVLIPPVANNTNTTGKGGSSTASTTGIATTAVVVALGLCAIQ